uniref:Cilia- and flagella-associated protein 263 n=1 Tax=Eptatretus burgeri TaxID=7764 RepID=A0A8C4R577_EPTBU
MEPTDNRGPEKTVEETRGTESHKMAYFPECKHAMNILRFENELFQNYVNELENKGLTGPVLNASPRRFTPESPSRRRSRGHSNSSLNQQLTLTIEQQYEIVQHAVDNLQAELAKSQYENELVVEKNKAALQNAMLRLGGNRQALYEFKQNLVNEKETGKPFPVEKFIKYIEECLHTREMLIDRLKQKNICLRGKNKKIQMQILKNEEISEVLREGDFSHLQIQNQQCVERIAELKQEILRLKVNASQTMQTLTCLKAIPYGIDGTHVQTGMAILTHGEHIRCNLVLQILFHYIGSVVWNIILLKKINPLSD